MTRRTALFLVTTALALVFAHAQPVNAADQPAIRDISEKVEPAPVVQKAPPVKKAIPVKAVKKKQPAPPPLAKSKKVEQFVVNPDGTITINAIPGPDFAQDNNAKPSLEHVIKATEGAEEMIPAAIAEPAPAQKKPEAKKMAKQAPPMKFKKESGDPALASKPGDEWWKKASQEPPVFERSRDLKAPPSAPDFLHPSPSPQAVAPVAASAPAPAPKQEPLKEAKVIPSAPPTAVPAATPPTLAAKPAPAANKDTGLSDKAKNWLNKLKPLGVSAKAPDNSEINDK